MYDVIDSQIVLVYLQAISSLPINVYTMVIYIDFDC